MDVVHGLGHGGDVFLGCAGDGVVVDLVGHFLILVWEAGFCLDERLKVEGEMVLVGWVVVLVIGDCFYEGSIRREKVMDLDQGHVVTTCKVSICGVKSVVQPCEGSHVASSKTGFL